MQRISLAPVLSATLSRDSAWIIDRLPRPVQDLDQAPALGLAEWAALDHPDGVPRRRLVALVVSMEGGGLANDLLVPAVLVSAVDPHGDGLVGLVRDHDALALARLPALALGGRRGLGRG